MGDAKHLREAFRCAPAFDATIDRAEDILRRFAAMRPDQIRYVWDCSDDPIELACCLRTARSAHVVSGGILLLDDRARGLLLDVGTTLASWMRDAAYVPPGYPHWLRAAVPAPYDVRPSSIAQDTGLGRAVIHDAWHGSCLGVVCWAVASPVSAYRNAPRQVSAAMRLIVGGMTRIVPEAPASPCAHGTPIGEPCDACAR